MKLLKNISILVILFLSFLIETLYSQIPYWEQSEGPFCGCVVTFYKSPDGKMFAGTAYDGGIYLSTNGGYNWKQIGSFGGIVRAFFMNKQNSSLYVGTSGGIYFTTDLGKNWSNVSYGLEEVCTISIDIDYSNGFMYSVTTHYPAQTPDPIRGIHLSINNGFSWMNISNGIENKYIRSVFVDSVSKRIFCTSLQGVLYSTDIGKNWKFVDIPDWAVYSILRSKVTGELILTAMYGVYISNDNGDTWNKIIEFKELTDSRPIREDPKTGEILVSDLQNIFILQNINNSWVIVKKYNIGQDNMHDCIVNSNGHIFISRYNDGILVSKNEGSSWNSTGVANASVRCVLKHPVNGNVFIGTSGASFVSKDEGDTWSVAKMLPWDVRTISLVNNSVILAGSYDSKLYHSFDTGASWYETGSGLPKSVITIQMNKKTKSVFAGTNNGIFKSTDNGRNWRAVNNGIGPVSIKSILMEKNDEEILLGTSEGIYFSNNDGEKWQLLNNIMSNKFVWCLVRNESNGFIYSGTNGDGIFRSEDCGRKWEQINTWLGNLNIKSIVANSSGEVFSGSFGGGIHRLNEDGISWMKLNTGLYDGYVNSMIVDSKDKIYIGVENGGIYYSTDAITPVKVFPGDANNDCMVDVRDIYPLVVYYNNSGDERLNANIEWFAQKIYLWKGWEPKGGCYADCDGNGVVDSKDIFQVIHNWGKICYGNNIKEKDELKICEELLLELNKFPKGESVDRLRQEILNYMKTKLSHIPLFLLKQNYPNPFNNSTQIRYFIPQDTKEIKFIVYSSIGQIMWKRSIPDVLPGYHEMFFKAIDETNKPFCSGVYYLVMYIKESYQVIKMLMIK